MKTNGHIKDPKELAKLNKQLRQSYNRQAEKEQANKLAQMQERKTERPEHQEVKQMSEEKIDHPAHYNPGNIEAISVIEDWNLDFHLGNVVKYICRSGKKDGNEAEDLQKAFWYLQRKIKNLNSQEE